MSASIKLNKPLLDGCPETQSLHIGFILEKEEPEGKYTLIDVRRLTPCLTLLLILLNDWLLSLTRA